MPAAWRSDHGVDGLDDRQLVQALSGESVSHSWPVAAAQRLEDSQLRACVRLPRLRASLPVAVPL